MRGQGFTADGIAREYGWTEEDVRLVLSGSEPTELRELALDARKTGQRLLNEPPVRVLRSVFGGDMEAYRRCVLANFGDALG